MDSPSECMTDVDDDGFGESSVTTGVTTEQIVMIVIQTLSITLDADFS